ncbi:MAG: L-threonine 3-dehydrogenase [Oscillibacter sp.]|jgi:threonine 3-dehydrogenase|nr:L-threonine 3-dehydrogenase [Oscillibacter sp.]
MTGTMRAVIKTAPQEGCIELRTVPIPQIGPREILVRVKAAAVCGTDVHIRHWNAWAQKRMNPPVTIGHEFSGEVVEIGSDCHTVKVGDRVSSESHIPCNNCQVCHEGNRHVCPNTKCIGVHQDGCFAEYIAIPEEIAFVYNDPNLPWEILALMEPFGVSVHGVMDVPLATKSVAIIGAGPLGEMGILVAKKAGAAKVIVLEPNAQRAATAKALGADAIIDPIAQDPVVAIRALTDGYGPHVAIDFSGSSAGIASAMQYLRPEGQLTCVALPNKPVAVDIADFGYRGCKLRGIAGRRMYENWEEMRGLLAAGIDLSPIVTHTLPLEEFQQGLDLTEQGKCCKCILIP